MERMSSEFLTAEMAFLEDEADNSRALRGSISPLSHNCDLDQLLDAIGDIGDAGGVQLDVPTANTTAVLPQNAQFRTHISSQFELISSSKNIVLAEQSPKKKKKLNYDPNKARNERRFELKCLQKQVQDLELTLTQLQSIRTRNGGHSNRLAVTRIPRAGDNQSAVWEGICARQLERRLRAERENIHLKMIYSRQMQVARSLERQLQRRTTLRDVAFSETSMRTRRVEVSDAYRAEDAARIFQELLDGVDAAYRDVEDIFEANSSFVNVQTREPLQRDAVNGMYMELFDSKIMPFGVHETGEAWWRRWHNYKGHGANVSAANTITEKFGLEMADIKAGTRATFYVQQILRRHVESNRTVIVWYAHIEPFEFENKRVSGIHFLEKGYVLIKPRTSELISDSSNSQEASSRVLTCYVIIPHGPDDPEMRRKNKMVALTKFVMSATSANIATALENVESLLVDQALR